MARIFSEADDAQRCREAACSRCVAAGPALIDGAISRLVDDASTGMGSVETWDPVGKSWGKGGAEVREVLKAPEAGAKVLASFGLTLEPARKA